MEKQIEPLNQKEKDIEFKDLFTPLTNKKAIFILIIVGFLVFFNSLFTPFVWDDRLTILQNPEVHQVNIVLSFSNNNLNNSGQYRPLSMLYFSVMYSLFSDNTFFWHLANVSIHIVNAFFLYLLLKKFIEKKISLLLSLFFIIHPLQVESVTYIGGIMGMLAFLFGISALLVSRRENLKLKNYILISLLLLASLLSKESGIIFLILFIIYQVFILKRKNLLKTFIVFSAVTFFYLLLRLGVAGEYFGAVGQPLIPIVRATTYQRFITIPAGLFYYIKNFIFPKDLAIQQDWLVTQISLQSFYIPLLLDVVFFGLIISISIFLNKKKKLFPPYIFFLIWLLFGFGILSQIVPLDVTVSDRWFYILFAGLVGVLGIILQSITNIKRQKIIFSAAIILLVLFSIRTLMRNADYQSPLNLYLHDSQVSDNFLLEQWVALAYSDQGDYSNSLMHLSKSASMFPTEITYSLMGINYEKLNKIDKAQEMFIKAVNTPTYLNDGHKHRLFDYEQLGDILVIKNHNNDTKKFLLSALNDYPDAPHLWYLLSITEYYLGDKKGSLIAAEKSLLFDPSNIQTKTLIYRLQNNLSLQFK